MAAESSSPRRVRKATRPENAIGSLIRELRIAKGWTQEDLAAAAEIDHTYVSLLERFQRDPSLSIVMQLARALDMAPGAFVEEIARRMGMTTSKP
jgi:transcriptional regulator with XRE-family HTH domain